MFSPLREWLARHYVADGAADLVILALEAGVVIVLAVAADFVAKRLAARRLVALSRRSTFEWNRVMVVNHRVPHRLAHLAPALVVYYAAIPVLADFPALTAVVRQAALIYMIVVGMLAADAGLNAAVELMQQGSRAPRGVPVKSLAQVVKLALYAVAGISVVSLVMGRSPAVMLGGLGAMSAVLMLVFRDAILGFVAGIQLATNRMVSRGDWIEMPNHGADGDVVEVGLTTVKVQNFDKTIVTIPTYALISESFKNWRGMAESGGRRIKRALRIDMHSVAFCTDEMLDRFARIRPVAEQVRREREAIARRAAGRGGDAEGAAAAGPADDGRPTNVGIFRAYVKAYLRAHPMVNAEMTFLVRQLDPTEHGLPIEIYVFSREQRWAPYEDIQADVIDHLLAMAPQFDLRVFQNPSGPDVERALAARSS